MVLGFAVFSGLFFIRTIVRPHGQVEATANRIAHGDLTTRLQVPRMTMRSAACAKPSTRWPRT